MTTRRTTDELLLFAVVRIRVKQRALRSRHVSRLGCAVGVVVRVIGLGVVGLQLVVSNVIGHYPALVPVRPLRQTKREL